eukprot:3641731-Pyramimonas_sp.AAC.1
MIRNSDTQPLHAADRKVRVCCTEFRVTGEVICEKDSCGLTGTDFQGRGLQNHNCHTIVTSNTQREPRVWHDHTPHPRRDFSRKTREPMG